MKKLIVFVPLFTILLISLPNASGELKTTDSKNEQKKISDLEQAIQKDPTLVNIYIELAKAYSKKKEYEKAINYLNKALELNSDANTYLEVGKIYFDTSEFKKAISSFKKSLKLNPNLWKNHLYLSWAYVITGHLDKAVDYLKQSFKKNLDPQQIGYLQIQLGLIYLSQENYTKALNIYKNMLTKYKNLPGLLAGAQNCIAKVYYEKGDFKKAENALNVLLQKLQKYKTPANEIYLDSLIYLGCIYFETGNNKKAIKTWEKAAKIGKNFSNEISALANFLAGKISLDKLIPYIQIAPWWKKNIAFFLIGIKYESGKELNKARSYYNKSLEISKEIHDFPYLPVIRGLKRIQQK